MTVEEKEAIREVLRDVIGKQERHTEKCAEYRKNSQTSICICFAKTRNKLRLEQIEVAQEKWGIKV